MSRMLRIVGIPPNEFANASGLRRVPVATNGSSKGVAKRFRIPSPPRRLLIRLGQSLIETPARRIGAANVDQMR